MGSYSVNAAEAGDRGEGATEEDFRVQQPEEGGPEPIGARIVALPAPSADAAAVPSPAQGGGEEIPQPELLRLVDVQRQPAYLKQSDSPDGSAAVVSKAPSGETPNAPVHEASRTSERPAAATAAVRSPLANYLSQVGSSDAGAHDGTSAGTGLAFAGQVAPTVSGGAAVPAKSEKPGAVGGSGEGVPRSGQAAATQNPPASKVPGSPLPGEKSTPSPIVDSRTPEAKAQSAPAAAGAPPPLPDDQYNLARAMVPAAVRTARSGNKKAGSKGAGSAQSIDNIRTNWAALREALRKEGIDDDDAQRYVMASIRAETGDFRGVDEKEDYDRYKDGKLVHKGNSTPPDAPGHHPFDHYDTVNGNTKLGDGEKYRGRGLGQLTGRNEYAAMQRETGLPLIEHPEMASDPKYEAVIFAKQMAELFKDKHTLRDEIKGGGKAQTAEDAFTQYRRYLEDVDDKDQRNRQALSSNGLVLARTRLNGMHHYTQLPNGLENYLTAYLFGSRQSRIESAIQDPKFTVGATAAIWAQGDQAGQDAYLQSLAKAGISADMKYSELSAAQKAQVQAAQSRYAGRIRQQIGDLAKAKESVIAPKEREWNKQKDREREAAKKKADAARKATPAAKPGTQRSSNHPAGGQTARPGTHPEGVTLPSRSGPMQR